MNRWLDINETDSTYDIAELIYRIQFLNQVHMIINSLNGNTIFDKTKIINYH